MNLRNKSVRKLAWSCFLVTNLIHFWIQLSFALRNRSNMRIENIQRDGWPEMNLRNTPQSGRLIRRKWWSGLDVLGRVWSIMISWNLTHQFVNQLGHFFCSPILFLANWYLNIKDYVKILLLHLLHADPAKCYEVEEE